MNIDNLKDLEENIWGDDAPEVSEPEKTDSEKLAEEMYGTDQNKATVAKYVEDCKDCRGTGVFTSWAGRTVGKCFKCKGKGERAFKTSPETRKNNREKARERREASRKASEEAAAKSAAEWLESHPEIKGWMDTMLERNNSFAISLNHGLQKYGSLTEKQEQAVLDNIEKGLAVQAAAKTGIEFDGTDLMKLHEVFDNAKASGLKNPKLRIGELVFTKAKDHSKNPGHLYVKSGSTYIGKIDPEGALFKGRDCEDEHVELIMALGEDPLEQARLHGQETGECSCCGRELTDPISIENGIGPICASKWGLG